MRLSWQIPAKTLRAERAGPGGRATARCVGHNDTVSDTRMTSSVDNILPFEQTPTKRTPIISWRILTAILAALAMVVILFLVPVPFVVNSPGPTFNVLGSDKGCLLYTSPSPRD